MSEFNVNINPQQGQIPDLFQKLEDNGKKLDIIDAPIDFSQGNNKEVLGKEPISQLDELKSKVNLDELDEFAKEFLEIQQEKNEKEAAIKEAIEGLRNGTLKPLDPGTYAKTPEGTGEKVTDENIDDITKEYKIPKDELNEAMKNGSVEVDGDKIFFRDENGRVTKCYDYKEGMNGRSCYEYHYNEDGSYTMTEEKQQFFGYGDDMSTKEIDFKPRWGFVAIDILPRGYDKDGNFNGKYPDDPNTGFDYI